MEEVVRCLRMLTASCNKEDIERASHVIRKLGGKRSEEIGGVTNVWCAEFTRGVGKELAFLYVVNDVVQKTRKDGSFGFEFARVLEEAFGKARMRNRRIVPKMERIVKVWRDRSIYRSNQVKKFLAAIRGQKLRMSSGVKEEDDHDEMSSPAPRPVKRSSLASRKRKSSRNSTSPRVRPRKFPPIDENDLRSVFQHLCYAKKKSREGREKLSTIAEEIIREGKLPPEFVDKLGVLSSEEFEGIADQVKATLEALELICSGLKRSDEVRKTLKRVIDAEREKQNEMIADIEKSFEESEALVKGVKMMAQSNEADEGVLSFDLEVEAEIDDDGPPSITKKGSVEVLNLLKALEPDDEKMKRLEEEAKKKKIEMERAEEEERERKRKRSAEVEASSRNVWDPRLRAYVTVSENNTGDDWRN